MTVLAAIGAVSVIVWLCKPSTPTHTGVYYVNAASCDPVAYWNPKHTLTEDDKADLVRLRAHMNAQQKSV